MVRWILRWKKREVLMVGKQPDVVKVPSGDYSPVVVCRLLIAVASLAAEHGF